MNLHAEFESFITQHLPAVQRLEFAIERADDHAVVLSAPLEANYNDKGTAFGGSLYMLALSTAWGFTYLNMVACGQKESQYVIAKAGIQYLAPVTGQRFYAMAARDELNGENTAENIDAFTLAAKNADKSRLDICASVYNENPLAESSEKLTARSQLRATFCLTP